jgi:PEGA domain-containing protein
MRILKTSSKFFISTTLLLSACALGASAFAATSIKVTSAPSGAKIFLNGEDQHRTTPATLRNLEEGKKYKIELKRKGYKDYETSLKPVAGTNHIQANLEKEKEKQKKEETSSKKSSTKTKTDESSGTAVERTFGYKKIYKEGTYGWLEVSTAPQGAVVSIDDHRQVGLTPNKYKLPVGTVKVSVVIKGKAMREFSGVKIRAGETTTLEPIDFRDEVSQPNMKPLLK